MPTRDITRRRPRGYKETPSDRDTSGIVGYNLDLDTSGAELVELLLVCDRGEIDEWIEKNGDGFEWLDPYWSDLVETLEWW